MGYRYGILSNIVNVLLLLFITTPCFGNYDSTSAYNFRKPGPWVTQTHGEPWPKPQYMANDGDGFMIVRPSHFKFEITNNTCDILEDALKRYYSIIIQSKILYVAPGMKPNWHKSASENKTWKANENFNGYLDVVQIELLNPCESMPHDSMEEAYKIKIDIQEQIGGGIISSSSNWGILRALETFTQLLHPTEDYTGLQINNVLILDYPRFKFRSILLDTSRHYISKKVLFQNLDLMAMNKYNVFHWHIVDDQSFPYQSKRFPAISDKGAYHAYTHVYSQQDVKDVIQYARLRGIRVVSEFDTPGHTESWGPAVTGFLTTCYDSDGQPNGKYGPINPSRPENFKFLREFFEEIVTVFPDKYLHLGGDEVEHDCWASNPDILEFMKKLNYTNYSQLEGYYMQNLVDIVQSFPQNNSYLVWQEVFDRGVRLNNNTIVHVWKHENVSEELANVTSSGYRTLIYSCWYLNYISYGIDWEKYYHCDPHDFPGTEEQKRLVFGGGAAMWGEYVDSTNLIPRLWPRAVVPAERLWSSATANDTKEAAGRLEEHRCRLLQRGYSVEPINGPGYCLISWD